MTSLEASVAHASGSLAVGLATWYRTLRRTRWSQLFWRLRYGLERRRELSPRALARWRWAGDRPPRLRIDFPDLPVFHRPDACVTALLRRETFHHLNESISLGNARPDWRLGSVASGRLWTVTLHYHAWARELAEHAAAGGEGAAEAVELLAHYVSDWLSRCAVDAPGARALAWNAYAVATRLTEWVRVQRLLGDPSLTLPARWQALAPAFLAALWQQAAYLHDHLEWDLRANHLLRDAVGLAWAGRFFAEPQARRWLDTATTLALGQATEQVLPDGGHFERSPMYHLHAMEDVLSLALLVEDRAARARLRQTWQDMAEYAAWLRHPDGDIPLFNDAALRAACAPTRMLTLGEQLGAIVDPAPRRGGRHFATTGLAVWHGDPWTLFFDMGPVGPDYQPGHAHADTLALECSYRGERLFVDPGTFAYDNDAPRRYDRSTAAHNTVCIDGRDSSEVWHIFRVGRRASPLGIDVRFGGNGMKAEAGHDGYDHLPGRPRHTRRVEVAEGGDLVVADRVEGRGRHLAEGGLLLAPGWTATATGSGWLLTQARSVSEGRQAASLALRVDVRGPEGLILGEERRPYHPEFGREVDTVRLGWRVAGPLPLTVSTRVEKA